MVARLRNARVPGETHCTPGPASSAAVFRPGLFVLAAAVAAACAGCGPPQAKPQAAEALAWQPEASPAPLPVAESRHLAQGTVIHVEMREVLDSEVPIYSQFIRASIADDVQGADSRLAIPAGAKALVVPLVAGKVRDVSQIGLSLYSVDLDGRHYRLTGDDKNPAVANVMVDSSRTPINKTVHISAGDIVDFALRKRAELR